MRVLSTGSLVLRARETSVDDRADYFELQLPSRVRTLDTRFTVEWTGRDLQISGKALSQCFTSELGRLTMPINFLQAVN